MEFGEFLRENKYVIEEKLTLGIIKQKGYFNNTILHYLTDYHHYNFSFSTIKHVLKFCIINRPSLFFEKNLKGYNAFDIILRLEYVSRISKTILKISTLHYPYFIFKIFNYSRVIHRNHFLYEKKFCLLNFPEISIRTNNFILPLMMEIQN